MSFCVCNSEYNRFFLFVWACRSIFIMGARALALAHSRQFCKLLLSNIKLTRGTNQPLKCTDIECVERNVIKVIIGANNKCDWIFCALKMLIDSQLRTKTTAKWAIESNGIHYSKLLKRQLQPLSLMKFKWIYAEFSLFSLLAHRPSTHTHSYVWQFFFATT